MYKIERDYEMKRRKQFKVQKYDKGDLLEYYGEICSKLKFPQGIGKMIHRSGEIQEGWFDMGGLRKLRRTRMGNTNRFARSIYTFVDPVKQTTDQMKETFSILVDKDHNVVAANGPYRGGRITMKPNGDVIIR